VNTITLVGFTGGTTVNGSIGKDTIINSDGGDVLSAPTTNSSDVYVGGDGTDTISYDGNTHDAASGTDGAGATTDGYAMNFTGSTITFDHSSVSNATNITTLAANTVAQYDSTATSSTSTTAGSIVAGGETDSVTGFEVVIGSAKNDYIAVANTGMTVTAGGEADTIVLNAGTDVVKYTATTAAEMATETGSTAGTDVDFSVRDIGDDIVSFTSGTDKFHFSSSLVNNGTDTDTLKSIGAGGTVADNDVFVEVTAAATDGTFGSAVTLLNALTTSAVAIGEDVVFFINDGTDGYLYLLTQVSAADTIAAQDLTLIGKVTGVTDVANGDFVSF
jgi:hypothetical protein